MEKVNWSLVIFDLLAAGETLTSISRKLGVSHSCVIKLRNRERHQPNFTNGVRLLSYWKQKTKQDIPPKLSVIIEVFENGND